MMGSSPRWSAVSTETASGIAVSGVIGALTVVSVTLAATSGAFVGGILVGLFLLVGAVLSQGTERVGTGLAVVAMVLSPMNAVRPVPGLTFVTASDAMFALAFTILLPTLLRRRVQLPSTLVAGIVILVGSALVASVISDLPFVSLALTVRLVVGAFGLPILFLIWSPRESVVRWLAAGYLLGASLSTVIGVLRGPDGDGGRYAGLTTHANILGLTMLLAVAIVPFLCHRATVGVQVLAITGGVIASYGLYISGSRAALAVLIAIALIYPQLTRSLVPIAFMVTGFAIFLAFSNRLLAADSGNAIGRLLGGGSASGSDIERENAAREALEQFHENPIIGGGLSGVLEAHNIYLQAVAAVGVIGLVGYVLVFITIVRPLLTLPSPYHLLALPALAYATLGFVTSLMWDRYIWSMMSLALLAPVLAKRYAEAHPEELEDDDQADAADSSAVAQVRA
ncbi:O-antigen ligase [Aeromicrobium sp. Leaf350]|uniref:O-antigen ligase family protein n=1 Tax=Aeromicrobium sp. Leaf350 TaxID=2876565 RepID=UPI001E4A2982|nr:O-antigen ligase family protein [Aeromicrobium sp. Leaf350]